jgi:hypothetical protein
LTPSATLTTGSYGFAEAAVVSVDRKGNVYLGTSTDGVLIFKKGSTVPTVALARNRRDDVDRCTNLWLTPERAT